MVADWRPYWSMPPPWKAFAVSAYGASTSSTNPRACSERDSDLMKPGVGRDQEEPRVAVEACGFEWFDHVPGGKFVRRPR